MGGETLQSLALSLSEARAALNSFQDEVWGSFDGWSKSLGWGLTGIQPECFAMMDASVRELVEARKQLDAISAAIGSTRFMDPPDGGDVSLVDQVRRMRAELEAKEARLAALENCKPVLADAPSKSPDSDLSSLRKGAEVVGEIVMFAGVGKEVSWRKGKMPPVGTKLCAHPPLTKEEGE